MDIEELNLQHGLPGRPESPTLETTARKAVESAIRQLVTEKLLYQKVEVDLSDLEPAFSKIKVLVTPQKLASFKTEVSTRPWQLETHHMGDNPQHAEIHRWASVGGQAV